MMNRTCLHLTHNSFITTVNFHARLLSTHCNKHTPPRHSEIAENTQRGRRRGDADAHSGIHFDSSAGRRLTCPGQSSSHDPCVCPRDQRSHLPISVSLEIPSKQTATFMDMLDPSLDSATSHEKQETEEVVQLQEGEAVGAEEQTAITIASVQQSAFADHNVQYQFRTENSGGQVTYRVVQVTDEQIEATADGGGAVSVVSAAAFAGAPQAVAQAVIQNPFSNGGSPAGETVGGETRFAYFPAATVGDGTATAVSVQATADPTLAPAGGQFYVMMSPQDVLQTGSPRTIAPRTQTYTAKMDGPRAPRDERRRAQHNEVERRRRDKINNWIVTLSKIIPDCNIDSSKTGAVGVIKSITPSMSSCFVLTPKSKGGILSKACDYIRELRQSNQRLQESYKEVERFQVDNELLRQQIEELKNDNALLRAQLQQHGIEVNGDATPQ
ncbi:upstream stimulatory factor 2 isoform X2 [Lampris incognitus]|uniref:upstream stimulatory factor 2 isoform X2 n=1 Tax=Lampris incognitus TaxID=2546036 RepID=UPI0024B4A2B5|nr:upstream stimulatory factor 2 isoform X2 [Lampris incognitus]